MNDNLTKKLTGLVVNNWAMHYVLAERANSLRQELAAATKESLSSDRRFVDYQKESHANLELVRLGTSGWYVSFARKPGGKYLSYVQVDFPTERPRMEARVWTGFAATNVVKAAVKAELAPALVSRYADKYSSSGQTVITAARSFLVDGDNPLDIAPLVASEVVDQLDLARALYDVIVAQVGDVSSKPGG